MNNDYTIKIEGYTSFNPRIIGNEIWIDVMPEWVSVEDRLPEEGVRVLVYLKAYNEFRIDYILKCGVTIWACTLDREQNRVTHWIPLPNPPNKHLDELTKLSEDMGLYKE